MFDSKNDNRVLRKLLWLNHGCPIHTLYGDDGEMQCSSCMIDFKRDAGEYNEQRFMKTAAEKMNKINTN